MLQKLMGMSRLGQKLNLVERNVVIGVGKKAWDQSRDVRQVRFLYYNRNEGGQGGCRWQNEGLSIDDFCFFSKVKGKVIQSE